MNKKFAIEISSDLDYEEMIAHICYENHTVAIVTQEKGLENMEIEILTPKGEIETWVFPLNDFLNALQFAKKKLTEMQKID